MPVPIPGDSKEGGEADGLPVPIPGGTKESGEADGLPVPIPGETMEGGEADSLPVPLPGESKGVAEDPDHGPNPFSQTVNQAEIPVLDGVGETQPGLGSSGAEAVGATPINLPRVADEVSGEEIQVLFDGESFRLSKAIF